MPVAMHSTNFRTHMSQYAGNDLCLHYTGSALVIALLADKWTMTVCHVLARGTQRTASVSLARRRFVPACSTWALARFSSLR